MSSAVSPYAHIQDVIQGVQGKYEESLSDPKGKINASSGLLIWRSNGEGNIQLLLGRVHKIEDDVEKVHGTFATFSGKVEAQDFKDQNIPGVIAAAARNVEKETKGLIPRDEVVKRIADKSTQCVKNAVWSKFCAPVFTVSVDFSNDQVEAFNKNPTEKVKEMKWISLKDVLSAQDSKDKLYNDTLAEIEKAAGKALSEAERFADPKLVAIFKTNPKLPSGDEIAHYVARTISLARGILK